MLNVSLGIRKTRLIFVPIKCMTQCFVVCLPSGSSFVTQALTNQRGITGYTVLLGNFPAKVFCFEMFVKSGMQQFLVLLLPQTHCDFKLSKRSKHRILSEKQSLYYVHRHKIVVGRVYRYCDFCKSWLTSHELKYNHLLQQVFFMIRGMIRCDSLVSMQSKIEVDGIWLYDCWFVDLLSLWN